MIAVTGSCNESSLISGDSWSLAGTFKTSFAWYSVSGWESRVSVSTFGLSSVGAKRVVSGVRNGGVTVVVAVVGVGVKVS